MNCTINSGPRDVSPNKLGMGRNTVAQHLQPVQQRAQATAAGKSSTGKLAASYTIAAASIATSDLPREVTKRLPRYEALPAVRIDRLAVDQEFRGRGLGGALLADAPAECCSRPRQCSHYWWTRRTIGRGVLRASRIQTFRRPASNFVPAHRYRGNDPAVTRRAQENRTSNVKYQKENCVGLGDSSGHKIERTYNPPTTRKRFTTRATFSSLLESAT